MSISSRKIVSVLILSMLVMVSGVGYGELIAHWPFDTDADDAVSSIEATSEGGASISGEDTAVGAGALSLDGVEDRIVTNVTNNDIALDGEDGFTIAVWVKTTSAASVVAWQLNGVTAIAGTKIIRIDGDGHFSGELYRGTTFTTE